MDTLTNRLYGVRTDGTKVINGYYKGYLFDDNGELVDVIEAVAEKYADKFNGDNSEKIRLNSWAEMSALALYFQNTCADAQGRAINYVAQDRDGMILRGDSFDAIKSCSSESTEAMEKFIEQAVSELSSTINDESKTDWEKLGSIHDYVKSNIEYDYSYLEADMATSINDKKGVCYQLARLADGVLKRFGYDSEIVYGGNGFDTVTNHEWNKVTVGDKVYYIDCTNDASVLSGIQYMSTLNPTRIG